MTPVGPIRGVEYAAEVYDLKALCSKLPLTAVMIVINFDEGVMNAFIGQDEKTLKEADPNVITLYNLEEDPSTIWVHICIYMYMYIFIHVCIHIGRL
jgi:hypothetical protein